MNDTIIGSDEWDCDGFALTPDVRRDILAVSADDYDSWNADGTSYRWDQTERRLVHSDPNQVETLDDFFGEISGPRSRYFSFGFHYIADDFTDWLKKYVREKWGEALYEETEDEDADPIHVATVRTFDWLGDLRVVDVLAWRKAEYPNEEDESFDEFSTAWIAS